MKIFLTGGTGFVGNFVAEKLLESGYGVRALVRRGSENKLRSASKCEIHHGDATLPDTIKNAVNGCDAVIHLIGIIREFPKHGITFDRLHVESTRNMAAAAMDAGVTRFVHMSSLGARPNAPSRYWSTKWDAEEYLRTLDLNLTMFRPSTILGPGGEFAGLLEQMVAAPATPVIGSGENKMQPISAWNVAEFFVNSLENPATIGKAYEVGGPEVLSYNNMLRVAGEVMGKKVRLIHFPGSPMKLATKMFERISLWPITTDQLAMLSEDSVCDNSAILADLPIELTTYKETITRAFGN